jgi:hypothetical protein
VSQQEERSEQSDIEQDRRSGSSALPPELEPLQEDRDRIMRILDRLGESDDLVERADIGSELARSVARYEDVIDRGILEHLSDEEQAQWSELTQRRDAVRHDLMFIHERTLHIDPRNVHASDGQEFEDCLYRAASSLPGVLVDEDSLVSGLLQTASDSARSDIGQRVGRAYKHASERPVPARTHVGRVISNLNVKLDHAFEDVASPTHPGSEIIDGPEPQDTSE